MRIAPMNVFAVLLVLGTTAGCGPCVCGGRNPDGDAGSDAAGSDAGSDSAASDSSATDSSMPPPCLTGTPPTLAPSMTVEFSFCEPDPQIAALMALVSLSPTEIEDAFELDNPLRGTYDFGTFGSRWVEASVDNSGGNVRLYVLSDELDVAMLCIDPAGLLFFVHDDFNVPPDPTGAGLDLMTVGTWRCFATTSPHTDMVPANMPLGPARFQVTTQ